MMKTITFPKVETVKPLPGKKLLVRFKGGEQKVYDCRPLLKQEVFSALQNDSLFRLFSVMPSL